MAEPPDSFADLVSRVGDLERRVTDLEKAGPRHAGLKARAEAPLPLPSTAALLPAAPAANTAANGLLAIFGRAMLGIAGAYLLRSIAAANVVPAVLAASMALLYALGWLMGAARTTAWMARTVYAGTWALILAPMLWELTLRFHVLTPTATAFALGLYVAVALVCALRCRVTPVLWVANGTAAGLAIALAAATHAIVPFACLLVAMLAAAEFSAPRTAERSVRVVVALAADLAVWIEIYFYSAATNSPTQYPPPGAAALLLPALALLLISCGFAIERGVWRRKPLSGLDVVQTTAAFFLGVAALMLAAPTVGTVIVRQACLLLAAGLYVAAYILFADERHTRNYLVFSTWSGALLLAGLWMSLNAQWLSALLGVAAVAAVLAGARLRRFALGVHGAVFLAVAAAAAGLFRLIAHALNGPVVLPSAWPAQAAAAAALLCYLASKPRAGESRKAQVLHLYLAAMATAATAAFAIEGAVRMLPLGVVPQPHHLALLRTLVLCLLALTLAYAGARRQRPELARIGYAAVALVALKLLVEDLPTGHLDYIAGSICLFALTLIAAPRMARGAPANSRKTRH